MKKCSKCGQEKEISLFPVSKKDGKGTIRSYCKACSAVYSSNYIKTEAGYQKMRLNRTSEKGKKLQQQANARFRASKKFSEWWSKNKHKYSCQVFARNASREKIKNNGIRRDSCYICGSPYNLEAHHEDYSNPLSVIVLCREHHYAHHMEIR